LLPDDLALSEWLVPTEAVIESATGERRILVERCRRRRAAGQSIAAAGTEPSFAGPAMKVEFLDVRAFKGSAQY